MFGCSIGCETRGTEQSAHRGREDHFTACLREDPFPDHHLGERERAENVDLEIMPHDIERNLGNRSALPYARIVDEDIKIPIQAMLNIVIVQNVQFLDAKRQLQGLGLGPQCGDLGPRLSSRNDLMARSGHAQCRTLAKSGTRAGDQDLSHHLEISSTNCPHESRLMPSSMAAPAHAKSESCATRPPDTPMAPSNPPEPLSGMPPAKVTSPSLVSSIPCACACGLPI